MTQSKLQLHAYMLLHAPICTQMHLFAQQLVPPLTGLRVLDLSRSYISGHDKMFSSLTGLEVLGLEGLEGPGGTWPLQVAHLEGLTTDLKELSLAHAIMTRPSFLTRLTALTRLNLQGARNKWRNWMPLVATLTNLASLNMSNCGLYWYSAHELRALTGLTELSLRDDIGNHGARSLAHLTNLQRLSVPFCDISFHSLLSPLTNLTYLHIDAKSGVDGLDYKGMFPCL